MARKRAKLTDFRPCHEVAYVPTCTASAASSASRTRTGSQPGRGVRGRGKLQAHSPATACLSTSVAPWRWTPTTPRLRAATSAEEGPAPSTGAGGALTPSWSPQRWLALRQRWPAHAKDLSTVEYAIGSISQYPQQGTAGNASEAHREAISVAPQCCGCLSCVRLKTNESRTAMTFQPYTHSRGQEVTAAVVVDLHAHGYFNVMNACMRAST